MAFPQPASVRLCARVRASANSSSTVVCQRCCVSSPLLLRSCTNLFAAALSTSCRRASGAAKSIPLDDGSAESPASSSTGAAGDGAVDFLADGMPKQLTGEAHARAREALIQEILSRDKEIFELKRQHELSMLRVEQHQRRMLKDQEDRGMYYEQNVNVHTFDTISVSLYSQRSTLYHTMNAERLRNLKIFLTVMTSLVVCAYLYYRYMINADWAYVEQPIKLLGSRVQAVREERWKRMSEAEQIAELQRAEERYKSQE